MEKKYDNQINDKRNVLLINRTYRAWEDRKIEPRWLLSVHNDISTICNSEILDLWVNNISPLEILKLVVENKIHVVWISEYFEAWNDWPLDCIRLLKEFKKDVIIVLWWFWPTFHTVHFIWKYEPDFLIQGHWEWAMRKLVEINFEKVNKETDYGNWLICSPIRYNNKWWNTQLMTNTWKLDINNLNFYRPNNFFQEYTDFIVDITRWCIWKCIFCDPSILVWKRKVENQDAKRSIEEIDYLISNISKDSFIWLWYWNTFNNANNVFELIKLMEEKSIKWRNFHICLRLDVLDNLIKNKDKVSEFLNSNKIILEIGLETFDTSTLENLKKIPWNDKNNDYFDKINNLAKMFPNTIIDLDIIPFTPWTTYDSLKNDYTKYIKLISENNNITINKWWIFNILVIHWNKNIDIEPNWSFEDNTIRIFYRIVIEDRFKNTVLKIFSIMFKNDIKPWINDIEDIELFKLLHMLLWLLDIVKSMKDYVKHNDDSKIENMLNYLLEKISSKQ